MHKMNPETRGSSIREGTETRHDSSKICMPGINQHQISKNEEISLTGAKISRRQARYMNKWPRSDPRKRYDRSTQHTKEKHYGKPPDSSFRKGCVQPCSTCALPRKGKRRSWLAHLYVSYHPIRNDIKPLLQDWRGTVQSDTVP